MRVISATGEQLGILPTADAISRAREQELDLVEVAPNERPKGVAEAVVIPVVPALLNAIYDATGHRFQSLPVTQAMIKRALQ